MIDIPGQIVIENEVIAINNFAFRDVTIEDGRREALEWAVEMLTLALSDETNFMPPEFNIVQAAIDAIEQPLDGGGE